ncbi:MAG: ABC transporter permease [Thermoanaerobaculia bacterium]|nr:ABC transporter permease [Thermoanaerobaculia bacterium]
MKRFAEIYLGLLLRLYPRRFRARHGNELRRIYLDRPADGKADRASALVVATLETLRDAAGAHLDARRRRSAYSGSPGALRLRSRLGGAESREQLLPTNPELRQTVRSLLRRPAFTIVVVSVLALGIGANTAIFSLVRGVLLEPLPFPEPDRLVRLCGTDEGRISTGATLAYLDIVDMAQRSRSFEGIAAYDEWTTNLTGDGEPLRLEGALVNTNYFDLLGGVPAAGRFFLPEEDVDGQDRVVVLEHGFWQLRYGGDPAIVGQTVVLNGRPHTVVGVAPAGFEDPNLSDDGRPIALWRPLGYLGVTADRLPNRGSSSYVAIGRLAPGVRLEAAQAELATIAEQLEREHPSNNYGRGVVLLSLQEQLVGNADESLWLLWGAVGFLLAIAVTNVTSMMLGRAAERAGESAVLRALGASRFALLRHGLLEGTFLAVTGGVLGIGLAHLLVRLVVDFSGPSLPRSGRVEIDGGALVFALALSAATSLVCGLLPAMRDGRGGLQLARAGSRTAGGASVLRLRGALVTLQIAMALVLLHGATLLAGSFMRLQQVDVGVEAEGLVTFDLALPSARYPEIEQRNVYFEEVLGGLATLPGIERASSTNVLPLSGSFDGNSMIVPGQPSKDPDGAWSAQTRSVSTSFFETAGIPILQGRPIEAVDRLETQAVAVVNQTVADRFWPAGDALGARFGMARQEVEIVGIAGDTKHLQLTEEPTMHVYLARDQAVLSWQGRRQTVLLRTAPASGAIEQGLVEAVRAAVWSVDPNIPVANLRSMQHVVDQTVKQPRLRAALITAFAALALLLGAVGIYGVSSYGIALERRALAVRMALGADRGDITRHVLGRVAAWSVVGSTVGLAGAWALGRLIERFLYGVEPLSLELIVPVTLLALVALAAGWSPARKAIGIDPASTLRGN